MKYHLAIVGAGSAAFSAAIRARLKRLDVIMIERSEVGGTCVNEGCIPSKALLAAAEARHVAGDQRFPGINTAATAAVQLAAVVGSKDAIVRDLRRDKYVDLAREHDWNIVRGTARFAPGPVLEVNGRTIEAEHYLVATGSAPFVPIIDGLGNVPYLTSASAMQLQDLPESLVVLGGGSVGLELGQLFARLGTRVEVVEALERIAPREEPEISSLLADVLRGEGVAVHAGATVTRMRRDNGRIVMTLDGDGESRDMAASHVLVATGRHPETSALNLHTVGVRTGVKGEVLVNEHLQTSNDRIWAAGDVTGHPQFVYVAGVHGTIVVDNAFDRADRIVDYRTLPRVTFTTPNIAAVGMTEVEAQQAGLDCECRAIGLDLVPRALVNRDTRGVVKVVAERPTGVVRGIHMLAPNAADALLAGVYAIECGMTVQHLANIWCPYLTIAEGIKLAAQAFTTDVSKLSCCGG
jgi:mercuric reductase